MERETGKRKTLLVFKILETKHMEIEIDYRWCLCLYSFIIIYFYSYFFSLNKEVRVSDQSKMQNLKEME